MGQIDFTWIHMIVLPVLGMAAGMGLLALISPKRFAGIANRSSHWVDTSKIQQLLDKRIDIDRHVLRYSRVFGIAVVAASIFLGYVYYTQLLSG